MLFADRLPEEAAELGRLAQLLKEGATQVSDDAAAVSFAIDATHWWSTDHTKAPGCVSGPTDLAGVCERQPVDVVNEVVWYGRVCPTLFELELVPFHTI